MRICVVADVHGNFRALARVAERADKLVILGDLLDYVDYHDPAAGILGELFGADAVRHFTELRAAGDFAELRRYNARLWSSVPDAPAVLGDLVRDRYRTVADIVGSHCLLTLGNVDVAAEWERVAGGAIPCRDAEVVEFDGLRWGFVAGGARRTAAPTVLPPGSSAWHPFVRAASDYRAAVAALGPVDVLCTHIPPDIAGLRYDVLPGRLEMAGPGLTDYIDNRRPALALFGHVHQPLAARTRRGTTECINAGHFQRTERPLIVDTDALRDGRPAGVVAAFTADR